MIRGFVISLLLHGAVLFIHFAPPRGTAGSAAGSTDSAGQARPGLSVTLAGPPASAPLPTPPPTPPRRSATSARSGKQDAWVKQAPQPVLSAPDGPGPSRAWSNAERAEMQGFLDELARPGPPQAGAELAQRARAMARQLGRAAPEAEREPPAKGKAVEPFSLEMYFDAFVRKLNRSAAFVRNDARAHGSRKALVEIALNVDGSLKSYRVLRAADQQAEIAYIKSVIDRAAPFSAFPPDIRAGTDALSVLMCILPTRDGESGGFSRSFGGQDCRD